MKNEDEETENTLTKPSQLIHLETLSPEQLEAMTQVEVEERIEEAAYALAGNYLKEVNDNYEGCVEVVSTVLYTCGAAISTQVGHLMVAKANSLAAEACRVVIPKEP